MIRVEHSNIDRCELSLCKVKAGVIRKNKRLRKRANRSDGILFGATLIATVKCRAWAVVIDEIPAGPFISSQRLFNTLHYRLREGPI